MKLSNQYLALIVLMVLLIGAGAAVMQRRTVGTAVDERQREWAAALTMGVAEGLARDIINQQALKLRDSLRTIVNRNPEMVFAYVTDFDGRVIAHTFGKTPPAFLADGGANADGTGDTERQLVFEGQPVTEVSHPVIDGMPARLYLGLSGARNRDLVERIGNHLGLILALFGGIGLVVGLGVGKRITRPLEALAKQVEAYGASGIAPDFSVRAGSAEIAQLRDAFRRMAEARQRAEAEIQQLNADLEQRVAQRTLELERANVQLHQEIAEREEARQAMLAAKEAAERANAAKSEFLSRMSHELRTPMNAILGFGQVLEADELTPDQRESVAEILRAGYHLLELINEVLDLSRIEAGRLLVSLEPVNVGRIAAESMALVETLAAQNRIMLDNRIAADGIHGVSADRTRLKQVLVNLLTNAVKYNREGGWVRLGVAEDGEGWLRIEVADNGWGIPPDKHNLVFHPFERLGSETSGIDGTGIGLALTKRLVELMGGEIGFASEVGRGTVFWMRLPRADVDVDLDIEHEAEPAPHLAAGVPVHTILCIEDNPANLRLIERLLKQRRDVRVLSAPHPLVGLELAAAHRPALILLDINLPDMDGYEVLRRLQAGEATRHIPVIGISANATAKDIQRAKAAGFDDYLTKPVEIAGFMRAVDGALKD